MAIKSNELRIGNLVNLILRRTEVHLPQITPFVVSEITHFNAHLYNAEEKHYEVTAFEVPIADLSPIPLTEEWLVKFSIEYTDTKTENGYRLQVGNAIIGFKDTVHYMGQPLSHIRYVHQLQNLYFALTGTELTYKV